MADVIDFPGKAIALAEFDEALRERQFDCKYAAEALKQHLPAEALSHIAGLHLEVIATNVVLAIDAARHGRRLDPEYDERRRGGVMGALSRLFHDSEPGGAPEPPEPPDCA